jgi:hypothetical protein
MVLLRFYPGVEHQKLGQLSQLSILYLYGPVCLTV